MHQARNAMMRERMRRVGKTALWSFVYRTNILAAVVSLFVRLCRAWPRRACKMEDPWLERDAPPARRCCTNTALLAAAALNTTAHSYAIIVSLRLGDSFMLFVCSAMGLIGVLLGIAAGWK